MRSKRAKKRLIEQDSVYKSKIVGRFINKLMLDGKKSIAKSSVYYALSKLAEDKKEAIKLFEDAIKNVMPRQEVRSRRVGGATYQVPTPLKHERSEALAVRWIVDAARAKKGMPIKEKILQELQAASKNEGSAIKKRDDVHRMADANKAFSHFKW